MEFETIISVEIALNFDAVIFLPRYLLRLATKIKLIFIYIYTYIHTHMKELPRIFFQNIPKEMV